MSMATQPWEILSGDLESEMQDFYWSLDCVLYTTIWVCVIN